MIALVMTIGVGGGTEDGILFSIKKIKPNEITFLVTNESNEKLESLLEKISSNFSIKISKKILLDNEKENLQSCYEKAKEAIEALLEKNYREDEIYTDFTFGTKPMAAGLISASIFKQIKSCIYITGSKRDKDSGKVISGTEELTMIEPRLIFDDYNFSDFKKFFNSYQFNSARDALHKISNFFFHDEHEDKRNIYENFLNAYSYWDKFNYQESQNCFYKVIDKNRTRFISSIDHDKVALNSDFVKELNNKINSNKKYPKSLIIDIFENSLRREEEGKYDDALIRLYRVVELISQNLLFEEYNFDVSDVTSENASRLDASMRERYLQTKDKYKNKKVTTTGLSANFEILDYFKCDFIKKYSKDLKFRNALGKRNCSILTHNTKPINIDDFNILRNSVSNMVFDFFGGKDNYNMTASKVKMAKFSV